jgi:hypothetical protein
VSDISLKEYFDQKLFDLDRRYHDRFEAQNIAIRKAEDALKDRLGSMNEFRRQMDDMTRTFVQKDVFDPWTTDVRSLQQAKSNLDGRMAMISLVVSAVMGLAVIGITAALRR